MNAGLNQFIRETETQLAEEYGASDVHLLPPPDPAKLIWPATLPVEVALRTASIKTICEAYGIEREEWDQIRQQPAFIQEVADWMDKLKQDGMSFKVKAALQSEELLKTSWRMIHDTSGRIPPSVRADLLKFTVRVAGLDASKDQGAGNTQANAFQININL